MTPSSEAAQPLQFPGDRSSLTHSFFKFPGKIHPPLVRHLLKQHPDVEVVCDAMSGCGTVAVETRFAGKNGIFADVDPLSCLVTRVKTALQDVGELVEVAIECIEAGMTLGAENPSWSDIEAWLDPTPFSLPKNAAHWFEQPAAAQLAGFLIHIHETGTSMSTVQRRACEAILAASVRQMSRADPAPVSCLAVTRVRRERLARGNVRFNFPLILTRKLDTLTTGLAALEGGLDSTIEVYEADARAWSSVCEQAGMTPDLAITSPPYCHAIEYWRRHTLETQWLGLLDAEGRKRTKRKYLGANVANGTNVEESTMSQLCQETLRAVEANSGKRERLHLGQYFEDLRTWLRECYDSLAPGGTAYVVVGPNTVRGVVVDTPRVVAAFALEAGFAEVNSSTHAYRDTYMQYPTNHGHRVRTESTLQLSKG